MPKALQRTAGIMTTTPRPLTHRPEGAVDAEACSSARMPEGWRPSARPKPRLRRREASAYLDSEHGISCAPATLAKLACIGGGPAFHKAGRTPLYPREELDRWAKERLGRLVRNTSELSGL
jgi:hypothetical protein